MQLLYFIITVTSQVHSARHHQRVGVQCSTERLVFFLHPPRNTSVTNLKDGILEPAGVGEFMLLLSLTAPTHNTTPPALVQPLTSN